MGMRGWRARPGRMYTLFTLVFHSGGDRVGNDSVAGFGMTECSWFRNDRV